MSDLMTRENAFRSALEKSFQESSKPRDGKAGIELSEIVLTSLVQIGSWPDSHSTVREKLAKLFDAALPEKVGDFTVGPRGDLCLCVSPGKYLLLSEQNDLFSSVRSAFEDEEATVLEMAHSRSGIRISGHKTESLLLKSYAVDQDRLLQGQHFQAPVSHISTLVIKHSEEACDVYCTRSFARSMFEWFTDASLEYGYQLKSR
ncbi:hypothetical protein [Kiloniella sp. b19]|uniref:hypothetical protein n=1 Tax=Kiloniella sp. GXU_MW_B19 TaxID=3141326 RepID=UPI0031E34489